MQIGCKVSLSAHARQGVEGILTKTTETQISLFWDEDGGGFFSTAADASDLILRLKDGLDNVEPSTNGISASNLNRLASYLFDTAYEKYAKRTVLAFEAEIMQHPFLLVSLMDAIVASRLGVQGIIVAGDGEFVKDALGILRSGLRPNRAVVVLTEGKSDWLRKRNELLKEVDPKAKRLEVCYAGKCSLFDLEKERAVLGSS